MRGDFYILKYFNYLHLPEHLQKISKPFHDLAVEINSDWINNRSGDVTEVEAGLRKLLEAKDCIVRSYIK